jgi:hypothetical protein
MLAYAANRPVVAERGSSPHALLGVIAAHVAVIAVVMSIRMDLPQKIKDTPLVVDLMREDDPPPTVPDDRRNRLRSRVPPPSIGRSRWFRCLRQLRTSPRGPRRRRALTS